MTTALLILPDFLLILAGRLLGDEGIALMAIVIGVTVPLVNLVSAWGLSHGQGRRTAREIAANPLILSCLAGVAWGAAGLPLPEPAQSALARLGAAAIVLGLLAVGAALNPAIERAHAGFVGWILAVKLVAVPAAVWLARPLPGLDAAAFTVALIFAALPTASAAYILAVRLGGDGRTAGTLVSCSVVASLLTLPAWLALAGGG